MLLLRYIQGRTHAWGDVGVGVRRDTFSIQRLPSCTIFSTRPLVLDDDGTPTPRRPWVWIGGSWLSRRSCRLPHLIFQSRIPTSISVRAWERIFLALWFARAVFYVPYINIRACQNHHNPQVCGGPCCGFSHSIIGKAIT